MRIAPCDDPGVVNQSRTPAHRGFRPDWAGLRPLDQHPRADRFPPEGRLDFAGAVTSGGCRTPPPTSVRPPAVDRSVVGSGAGWVPGETGRADVEGAGPGDTGRTATDACPGTQGWAGVEGAGRAVRPERRRVGVPAPSGPYRSPRGAPGHRPPATPPRETPGPAPTASRSPSRRPSPQPLRRPPPPAVPPLTARAVRRGPTPPRPGHDPAPHVRHHTPSSPRRGKAPAGGPTGRSTHRQARRGSSTATPGLSPT